MNEPVTLRDLIELVARGGAADTGQLPDTLDPQQFHLASQHLGTVLPRQVAHPLEDRLASIDPFDDAEQGFGWDFLETEQHQATPSADETDTAITADEADSPTNDDTPESDDMVDQFEPEPASGDGPDDDERDDDGPDTETPDDPDDTPSTIDDATVWTDDDPLSALADDDDADGSFSRFAEIGEESDLFEAFTEEDDI